MIVSKRGDNDTPSSGWGRKDDREGIINGREPVPTIPPPKLPKIRPAAAAPVIADDELLDLPEVLAALEVRPADGDDSAGP
jgi:hypothetical protein